MDLLRLVEVAGFLISAVLRVSSTEERGDRTAFVTVKCCANCMFKIMQVVVHEKSMIS